jgi:hypothetical protein
MAAADHRGPVPDLYQLLGVAREASREEIAQAWRRRARAEHPDARPADADAPSQFRALAAAWQVLGDPARRAAYDRALGSGQVAGMPAPAPVPVPVRRVRPGGVTGPVPGPPLRVGPVRVSGPHAAPAGGGDEDELRLAVLAALALRCLARDRDGLW